MNDIFILFISLTVSASLIAIIIFAMKPVLKNKFTKTWQYYIWLIVILRLLVPFTVKFNFVDTVFNSMDNYRPQIKNTVETVQILENSNVDTKPSNSNTQDSSDIWLNIKNNLWVFWLSVAIIIFAQKITSYYNFLRFIKVGRFRVSDPLILSIYQQICDELKIKRSPPLYINKLAVSPMLTGIIQPFIILPQIELSEQNLRYVFHHELTHYKRLDIFYKWIMQVAVCLHWFNPLVYFISHEINKSCELSCDEMVIRKLSKKEKQQYGDTLLTSINNNGYGDLIISITLNENINLLKERLEAIMKFNKKSKFNTVISFLIAIILCFGATFTGAYAKDKPDIYLDSNGNITTSDTYDKIQEQLKKDEGFPTDTGQDFQDMLEEKIKKDLNESEAFTETYVTSANNKNIQNPNDADKRGINIMEMSGTWGQSMDRVLPYMTPEGVEKAVAIYFDRHWSTKETATQAISEVKKSFTYMTDESVKEIEAMISNLTLPTNNSNYDSNFNNAYKSETQTSVDNKNIQNLNDADKRGINIMEMSGTWGESMDRVLPYMTPEGVEKAVAIYFYKHWYTTEMATRAISKVKKSFTYMTDESVKKIEAMISNLALPTNNSNYNSNFNNAYIYTVEDNSNLISIANSIFNKLMSENKTMSEKIVDTKIIEGDVNEFLVEFTLDDPYMKKWQLSLYKFDYQISNANRRGVSHIS